MKRETWLAVLVVCLLVLVVTISILNTITTRNRGDARAGLDWPAALAEDAVSPKGDISKAPESTSATDDDSQPGTDDAVGAAANIEAFAAIYRDAACNVPYEIRQALDTPVSELDDETRDAVVDFVQSRVDIVSRIRLAAANGGPVWEFNLVQASRGFFWPQLVNMTYLLNADAWVAAHSGDMRRAVDDFVGIINLSNALAEEPIMVGQSFRVSTARMGYDAIASVVPPQGLSPEDADTLVQALSGADHRDDFARSFVGEAAFVEYAMLHPTGLNSRGWRSTLLRVYNSPVGRPVSNMDMTALYEFLGRLHDAVAVPVYQSRPELHELEQEANEWSLLHPLAFQAAPLLLNSATWQDQHEALLDLAQIGVLVESYHFEYGRYPEDLAEVAGRIPGGLPTDPYTGLPYLYIPRSDSFTLYSYGSNLRDDGGRHDLENGDIVWRERTRRRD